MGEGRHLDGTSSGPADHDEGAETLQVGAPVTHVRPSVSASVARYVVVEEIGQSSRTKRGADRWSIDGRVLRAYDPKLQREVALKEVRGDGLGQEGRTRLVKEARAMAKLSHPNVVAVYDVEEVESGEVVLVMEYVAGQTLRAWLRETDRNWRTIVDTFREAGRGLAAAHGAGLLHRDFKPANVLVADNGTVKVTDFGLAKAADEVSASGSASVESRATDDGQTETGPELPSEARGQSSRTKRGADRWRIDSSILGTPPYIAPEQHGGELLTPATDQYAFCVALWEALCGAPPFSGKGMARDKTKGPPPWPKAGVPRPIVHAVVRGLSPVHTDRWPSMEVLLGELEWDPSRRRKRWIAGLGSAGMLGLVAVTWQSWAGARAERCTGAEDQLLAVWDDTRRNEVEQAILGISKAYATAVWERTERELDAYAKNWTAMHVEACEATTVRGEQSSEVMDLRMACLHRAAVDLGAVTAQLAEADAKVVKNAHRLTAGLVPLSRCDDVDALRQEVEPPLPEEAVAVEHIRVVLAEAKVARSAGRYPRAQQSMEEAKALLGDIEYGPVQTEVALEEGLLLILVGDYPAAETALGEALDLGSRSRQRALMAAAATQLMHVVGNQQRRMQEGLAYAELAAGLGAGDARREAASLNSLGNILNAQGKHKAAEAEHRRALALREKALGPEHPDVGMSRNNLANALVAQGKYEEAEAVLRRELALREKVLGPEHPNPAASRNNLGGILYVQGKHEESEAEYRRALLVLEKALGPEHPRVAALRSNLGAALAVQGKVEEAEAEHRRGLALQEKALGPDHPGVAGAWNNLGGALHRQGKYEEAEAAYRRALALLDKALGPEHPNVAKSRNNLATLLLDQGRPVEALVFAEEAWLRRQRDDIPSEKRAESAFVLARALWSSSRAGDDRARARALADGALVDFSKAGRAEGEMAGDVRAWLDDHRVP